MGQRLPCASRATVFDSSARGQSNHQWLRMQAMTMRPAFMHCSCQQRILAMITCIPLGSHGYRNQATREHGFKIRHMRLEGPWWNQGRLPNQGQMKHMCIKAPRYVHAGTAPCDMTFHTPRAQCAAVGPQTTGCKRSGAHGKALTTR